MNPGDLAAFNQAVQMAQSGQKEAAYQQLKALLKINNNHRDPNLLLWLAFASPKLDESESAINMVASIDPNNAGLASARDWLVKEQGKQAQPITTPPAPNYQQPAFASNAPVMQQAQQVYNPQPVPQNYYQQAAPVMPDSMWQAPGKSKRVYGFSSILVLALVAIGLGIFAYNNFIFPSDSAYDPYNDVVDLVNVAQSGERVKFELNVKPIDVGDDVMDYNALFDNTIVGKFTLEFSGFAKASAGQHVIFGKVTSVGKDTETGVKTLTIKVEKFK